MIRNSGPRGGAFIARVAFLVLPALFVSASARAADPPPGSLDADWKALRGEWRPMNDPSDGSMVLLRFYEQKTKDKGVRRRIEYFMSRKVADPDRRITHDESQIVSRWVDLTETAEGRYLSCTEKDRKRLIGYAFYPDYLSLNGTFAVSEDQRAKLTGRWVKLPPDEGAEEDAVEEPREEPPPRVLPPPRRTPAPRRRSPGLPQLPE